MIYTFRPYQEHCFEDVLEALAREVNRQLIVAATGTGKTVMLSELARRIGRRTLVLDHRDELTLQNGRKLVSINPDSYVGIEQGDKWCRGDEDIVVGSVQTLSRNKCKRLRRLLQQGAFGLVIYDEAHHCGAATYIQILECLQEYEPNIIVLGFTATPKPAKGKDLRRTFQEVTFNYPLRQAIEDGWLVDIVPDKVISKTNIENIHIQKGDFNVSELSAAVNTDERNHLIVNGWLNHAKDEQTILFCVDVAHAMAVTDLFCRSGVDAEMVIGETDKLLRKGIYQRFEERKTKVLVNVDVLTEGWDSPILQCVYMARPTKLQRVYLQQLGRGTRPYVDLTGTTSAAERWERIANSKKPHLHLLDVVDNTTSNSPVMLADIFDIPRTINLRKTPIVAAARRIEKAIHDAPNLNIDKLKDIDKLQTLVTEALRVKIWDIEPPKEVKENSRLTWTKHQDGYQIQLDKHETLLLRQNPLGEMEAVLRTDTDQTKFEILGSEPTLEKMFARADRYVENNYQDKLILLNQSARWHKDFASEKQIGLLRKFKMNIREMNGEPNIWDGVKWIPLKKGIASHLISQRFGNKPRTHAHA